MITKTLHLTCEHLRYIQANFNRKDIKEALFPGELGAANNRKRMLERYLKAYRIHKSGVATFKQIGKLMGVTAGQAQNLAELGKRVDAKKAPFDRPRRVFKDGRVNWMDDQDWSRVQRARCLEREEEMKREFGISSSRSTEC